MRSAPSAPPSIFPFSWAAAFATWPRSRRWLAAGITRVILGTAALTNPAFVKEAARAFPGRIVVGADAKGGKIATQGWAEVSELTPVELGKRFEDAGVAAILFTDIDGDGLLKGVNVTATAALARALSIPVIASGGVGSHRRYRSAGRGARTQHRRRGGGPGAL